MLRRFLTIIKCQFANGVMVDAVLEIEYFGWFWQCWGYGVVGCGEDKSDAILDWMSEFARV